MDSQFGLSHVWSQGDFVIRGVAVLLLVMSLASWLVILTKAVDIVRSKKFARRADDFWHSEDFATGLAKLGENDDNPFRNLALDGREAAAHHRNTKAHLHDSLDASDWITRSLRNGIDETTARLQSGLAILASVGSTAPFIGLFGTVWGIYHALMSIGTAGQATIDKVAGPIGEALIMTALGLVVAVPAVLAYNWLQRRNKSISEDLSAFSNDVLGFLASNGAVRPTHGPAAATKAPVKPTTTAGQTGGVPRAN